MMKKALSLLLTLAMVMSMFTVGAFADEHTGEKADPFTGGTLIVSAAASELVPGGKTELTPTYTVPTGSEYTFAETPSPEYTWTVKKVAAEGGTDTVSTDLSISTVGGKTVLTASNSASGSYKVSAAALLSGTKEVTAGEGESAETTTETKWFKATSGDVTITIDSASYKLQFQTGGSKQTLKLTPDSTGTLAESAQKVEFVKVKSGEETADTVMSGATITFAASNDKITYASGTISPVTGKTGANLATIQATCTFKGKTYTLDVCDVTVGTLGITKEIVNGSTATYSGSTGTNKSLYTAILEDLNSTLGNTTAAGNMISSATVTITPAASTVFKAYVGSETTAKTAAFALTASDTLKITAPAGAVKLTGEEWGYTVAAGGKTYNGKLTLKSIYAATVTASQYADFAKEEFYLDSVGSSIYYIRDYVAGDTTYSPSDTSIVPVIGKLVDPSGVTLTSDGKWTKNYIGYTISGSGASAVAIAHLVNVTFTAAEYDVLVSAKTGDAPFKFSDFETFTSSVNAEQKGYYAVSLAYVQFNQASAVNQWELKSGNSLVSTYGTAAKLNSSALSAVTVNVKQAGVYTIPFTVYFNYKTTNSSSWTTNAVGTYTGALCLYATKDGDIRYEVSYNENVTFNASDFLSYYRSATNKTGASLTRVVFTGGQPASGYLYTEPNRYGSAYLVDNSSWFLYAVTNNTDKDLGKVTYLAAAMPKTEYSVYIPFSAYGNSGTVSGMVEIIVNGALPFTDIGENHTFYKEIRYCYRNGIMGGKTDTYFDARSSVTRLQLVTTLYRIAGRPSQYNSRTITFSDCKNISNTEMANALKWAIGTGIVDGYSDNTYRPNSAVTRQAMVTILYRFANKYGYDTTVYSSNNLAAFKDAASVSSGMRMAMNWAVENKFLSGNNGKLLPGGSTTRGATAKILANFHAFYIG